MYRDNLLCLQKGEKGRKGQKKGKKGRIRLISRKGGQTPLKVKPPLGKHTHCGSLNSAGVDCASLGRVNQLGIPL